MNEVNCKNLSKVVSNVEDLKERFDHFFQSGDIKIVKHIKWEITEILYEVEKLLDPANIFLSEIKKESFWDEVVDRKVFAKFTDLENSHPNDARYIFSRFENAVARFPKYKSLKGSLEYQDFMERLVMDMEIYKLINKYRFLDLSDIYSMLNTSFLNKYAEDDQQIIVEKLHDSLKDYFGCFLKGGNLIVHEAGWKLGQYMSGGKIIAGKALEGAGTQMSGGTLKILKLMRSVVPVTSSSRLAGFRMSGGTLFIEETDSDGIAIGVAAEMSGGTAIAPNDNIGFKAKGRGTILHSNNIPHTIDGKREFFYNPKEHVYLSTFDSLRIRIREKIATNQKDIIKFLRDQTLVVVKDLSAIGPPPDAYVNGGILVYRDVPEKEIGKGMKAGAIIIENRDISIEEAKNRLSKDRPGGVVLMRVWNGAGFTATSELIDLEHPSKDGK